MMFGILLLSLTHGAAPEITVGPVEEVADGFAFTEGPVWMPDGRLLFSDIPNDTIHQAPDSVFRKPSGKSNGLVLDREGCLIACEHDTRRVTRTERDGAITVLAHSYEGKRFNSPNDAVVRSDGVLFFTDPRYGLEGRDPELDFAGVYALSPDGTLTLLTREFNAPNGIILSPDEKTLYVADSEDGFIRAFELGHDLSLQNGHTFCEVPTPDGMVADDKGRVWVAAADGVRVYAPDGALLVTVEVPRQPANCTFGGEKGKTLYITARSAVYKADVTEAKAP